MALTAQQLCRYAAVLLVVLTGVERTGAAVNRSKLFRCLHCKGAKNTCPDKDNDLTNLCVKPSENCYTMVQSDGEEEIVTRGCSHTRFCQFAKQVKLYQLKYCKQCDTEYCNNEKKPFPYKELDVDSGSGWVRGDVGVTLVGLLLGGTLLAIV